MSERCDVCGARCEVRYREGRHKTARIYARLCLKCEPRFVREAKAETRRVKADLRRAGRIGGAA